jgi:hypothetical protein
MVKCIRIVHHSLNSSNISSAKYLYFLTFTFLYELKKLYSSYKNLIFTPYQTLQTFAAAVESH